MARTLMVDKDGCISCGLCVELAPNTFALDDDGHSYVTDQEGDPYENIEEAIDQCPVYVISWEG